MLRNNYAKIQTFGSSFGNTPVTNPLSYSVSNTIDQRFLHGNDIGFNMGQHSKNAQKYLASYCAQGFDGFCELASRNQTKSWPNNLAPCSGNVACDGLTAGEALIQNTAAEKYLIMMGNCVQKFEPFDPTVADSPMISTWVSDSCVSNQCIPVYDVNPKEIDNDIVMNKILSKPIIAIGILQNIYNTRKRNKNLQELDTTKLGNFFKENKEFFEEQKGANFF